jgi:hypothetical protein
MKKLLFWLALFLLGFYFTAAASNKENPTSAHTMDVTINPAAIKATKRLGNRSFSPYANREFPPRPLWGDQHVHTSWSFDAGFACTIGVEAALRFARGEQVESTYGMPARLSRPLDWLVMTDHSDSLGFTTEIRNGNQELMADDLLKQWNRAMNSGDLDQIIPAAMDAIQSQGNGTLPVVAKDPGLLQSVWDKYTRIIESYNEPGRFTAFIGYEWTPNPGPGNNMHRNVVYRDGTLPPVGNTVDVGHATWTNSIGASEVTTVWKDPDFDPDVPAFYYARVIQIPTPRWTAYQRKRFQVEMPDEVPMTIQERAYTSPIWYTP